MSAAKVQSVLRFLSLTWLTGPVFGKELRIVSRQRRHYLLRFAYLALLTVFVVITWVSVVEFTEGSAASVYKMSDAGKTIISVVCWFQFIALQLVAVILMSTSISDEVYRGTLGVLMTTPITSLQIVAGKLLSKLLHLGGLLLVSLPLLAIVRVFGGVSWSFVIASSCITLTAVAFAGVVAMFFSTIFRRAYVSILLTLAAGFVFHLLIPWIFGMIASLLSLASGTGTFTLIFLHVNPFYAMGLCTFELFKPGSFPLPFFWPLHCVIMLGFTGGLLVPCVFLVRKAALRSAIGATGSASKRVVRVALPAAVPAPKPAAMVLPPALATPFAPPPIPPPAPPARTIVTPARPIRRITGSPLVWKKLRTPMLPGKILRIIAIVLTLGLILMTYALVGALDGLADADAHASYAVVFVLFGIVTTAVFAATSISSEKESRTLPILLTTPLGDWHIIGASVLEVLRRSLPIWLFLIGHVFIFTLIGYLHPIILLHIPMLIVWVIAFLTGTGLYFSSRFKRTTPAVVMNLGLALAMWAVLPIVLSITTRGMPGQSNFSELLIDANPVYQAGTLTASAGKDGFELTSDGFRSTLEYNWAFGTASAGETTWLMLLFILGYAAIGFLFLWRAKVKLRRNLF